MLYRPDKFIGRQRFQPDAHIQSIVLSFYSGHTGEHHYRHRGRGEPQLADQVRAGASIQEVVGDDHPDLVSRRAQERERTLHIGCKLYVQPSVAQNNLSYVQLRAVIIDH